MIISWRPVTIRRHLWFDPLHVQFFRVGDALIVLVWAISDPRSRFISKHMELIE
jgi:hypothetical protein